jgi:hypothetical protein
MNTREQAIQWFNEKDTYNKSELSHKYFKDTISYNFTALTGREIEQIWKEEVENPYLDRLRQQYKVFKKAVFMNREQQYNCKIEYQAMRLFCLDCELLTFNEMELMEYEVNQSFN